MTCARLFIAVAHDGAVAATQAYTPAMIATRFAEDINAANNGASVATNGVVGVAANNSFALPMLPTGALPGTASRLPRWATW